MSYRFMRIIVMFDLPSITSNDKREYRKFRKLLNRSGFIMMQESIYIKLVLNTTVVNGVVEKIRKNKPPNGIVQVLTITEKQFQKMEFIVGMKTSDTIDTDERLVVL